ncbi:MAG: hypothetical protein AAFY71_07815 [Bacteroidota bacterium]
MERERGLDVTLRGLTPDELFEIARVVKAGRRNTVEPLTALLDPTLATSPAPSYWAYENGGIGMVFPEPATPQVGKRIYLRRFEDDVQVSEILAVAATAAPQLDPGAFFLWLTSTEAGRDAANLIPGGHYYIVTDEGAFIGESGKRWGISGKGEWQFIVQPLPIDGDNGIFEPFTYSLFPENGSTNQELSDVVLTGNGFMEAGQGRSIIKNLTQGTEQIVLANDPNVSITLTELRFNASFFNDDDEFEIIIEDDFLEYAYVGAPAKLFYGISSGNWRIRFMGSIPSPIPDYTTLQNMQLIGMDHVNDTFTPVGNGVFEWFTTNEEIVLPTNDVTESRVFQRSSDGLRIKVVMVGDSPATPAVDVRIQRVTDASLASLLKAPDGKVMRFKLSGGNESGNYRFGQRVLTQLNNSKQPSGIGFPSENPSFNADANYTPIYLAPNVMVFAAKMWIEYYGEFPAALANGVGPGTPDEFGRGINDFQFKRGLVQPIFPEGEQSPYFFGYVTIDSDGDLAFQLRYRTYDGQNAPVVNHTIYQKIDRTKAYLRCAMIIGKSGEAYNKGRGYVWNLDLNANSTTNLLATIDTVATEAIPAANVSADNVHLDEFLAQGPGGTEQDEIMGVPMANNYASVYQSGSGATQQMADKNGGTVPEMNKIRHPYYLWCLMRNTQISTEAAAAAIDERDLFRMMLKRFKTKLS